MFVSFFRGGGGGRTKIRIKACPHCRRKVRQSPNFAVLSPFSATVALFCNSVDRALDCNAIVMDQRRLWQCCLCVLFVGDSYGGVECDIKPVKSERDSFVRISVTDVDDQSTPQITESRRNYYCVRAFRSVIYCISVSSVANRCVHNYLS